MVTLRILSVLLQYPSVELQSAVPELRRALADAGEFPAGQIDPLFDWLTAEDLLDCQEAYVETFDRGRAHSLHLFEHVHGESRDRGQAMVDLRDRYLAAGLEPLSNELPDFLPLFLEYCSTLPRDQAMAQLAEPGVVLVALAARLERRASPYAVVLAALCDLADIERSEEAENAVAPADDPTDLDALDKAWEAEEVTFGAAAPDQLAKDSCPQAEAMVARFRTPEAVPAPTPAAARSH